MAFPVSEDMMEWEADIEGLQDTFWHGIYFQSQSTFQKAFIPLLVYLLYS